MTSTVAPLHRKVALVTGSSKGIGRSLAIGLAQHGATVVVNYKTDRAGAEETASRIEQNGGNVAVLQADVSSVSEVRGLVDSTVATFGTIDVLVNNAGRSRFNLAAEITEEDWEDVVGTNLRGAFFASTAAARHMREGKGGSIVNISSCAASLTALYHSIYTMSKAGLEALTKQLALEFAPVVRVNALAPGPTGVERSRSYDPAFDTTWGAVVPMKRVVEPEDLVGPVVFLASEQSALMTGDVLHVDGGWTAQGVTPPMDDFDVTADRSRG